MAIDFSKINIGKDVADDLANMFSRPEFYEKVVKTSAEVHIEDARQKTSDGISPSGKGFPELSKGYRKLKNTTVRSTSPDLRFGYDLALKSRKPKSMDTMRYKETTANRGVQIYFDGSANPSRRISLEGESRTPTSPEYMYSHNYGQDGQKKRQIFPEEQDMTSPSMSSAKSKVTQNLTDYLKTPRIITVG